MACDIYRPAAIKAIRGSRKANRYSSILKWVIKLRPVDIAKAGIEHARENGNNVVIIDTAGRLHIDEDLMTRIKRC